MNLAVLKEMKNKLLWTLTIPSHSWGDWIKVRQSAMESNGDFFPVYPLVKLKLSLFLTTY